MLHCGGGFVLRHVCVCRPVPFDCCMVGRLAPCHRVIHRGLFLLDGLRLWLGFRTNGMADCLLVALRVCVCIRLCRMGFVCVSCFFSRASLGLARADALAVFMMLGDQDVSVFVVFVLCMSFCLFLCAGIDVFVPPTRLPNLVPMCFQ